MNIRDFILGVLVSYIATGLLFLFLIQPMERELDACKVKHNVHKCKRIYVPVEPTNSNKEVGD
jgi:hypothetical protein